MAAAAASKSFSAACLLALLVANTFLAGDAWCHRCRHRTPPSPKESCPTDTLKLGVCANVLGLVSVEVGKAPSGGGDKCCSLIGGLADFEAAVCLCTALKANVLGVVLNVPVNLSLILNYCGKTAPAGFQCA